MLTILQKNQHSIIIAKVYKHLTRVNLFTIVVIPQITPKSAFAHRVALTHDMAVDPAFTPVLPARLVVVCYKLPHYLRPSFDVIIHFLFSFSKRRDRHLLPLPAINKTYKFLKAIHNNLIQNIAKGGRLVPKREFSVIFSSKQHFSIIL